ncbi:MAG: uncharacterized protein QOF14_201 [Hyphomicrobiales bacterium]|jgi:uncharacterized DUF497 family protein|nr:uncharacterized protein [Hyphomicrobiales bacterium]
MDSIGGFDWDAGHRDKCRKHGLALAEIEAFFRGRIAVHPPSLGNKEERFIAVGSTAEGRNILVVFTLRTRNGKTLIRPISARYMHRREVAHYEKTAKAQD